MTANSYITPAYSAYLEEQGNIVYFDFAPGTVVTGELARESNRVMRELAGNQPAGLIADMRHVASMSREARTLYASAGGAYAVALLADSPLATIIANFFLGINRPLVSTRMFTSRGKARRWLLKTAGIESEVNHAA